MDDKPVTTRQAMAQQGGRASSWLRQIGGRNYAYIGFTALMVPIGMVLEASGPQGPDSGGGVMAALMIWGTVSLIFFVVNSAVLAVALIRHRSIVKPLIACALPIATIVGTLMMEGLVVP